MAGGMALPGRTAGARQLSRDVVAGARALVWLRRHGIRHGGYPTIVGALPLIANTGRIQVGSHFALRSHQYRPALSTGPGGWIIVGDDVFVNQGAMLHSEESIRIGSRVRIGDQVAIYDTNFHEVDPGAGVQVSPVLIEDDVWLARGVIVLPGARVGAGSVVAAGSVVRGVLPAGVVAAGSPAVAIRDVVGTGQRR